MLYIITTMYAISGLMAAFVAITSAKDAFDQRHAILNAPRKRSFSLDAPATFGELDVIAQLARKNAANASRTVLQLSITSLSAIIGSAASILGLFAL